MSDQTTPREESADEAPADGTPEDSDTPAFDLRGHPLLDALAPQFPGVRFERVRDEDVAHVPPEVLLEFAAACKDAGYEMFVDLCGVDYLRRVPRFEVVIQLRSLRLRHLLRIRVGLTTSEPAAPSITSVYPGANFYEREAYDLFGIGFDGHPDLTRILLPDDWEGHPLRKDESVGSVPVQFKGAHRAR